MKKKKIIPLLAVIGWVLLLILFRFYPEFARINPIAFHIFAFCVGMCTGLTIKQAF